METTYEMDAETVIDTLISECTFKAQVAQACLDIHDNVDAVAVQDWFVKHGHLRPDRDLVARWMNTVAFETKCLVQTGLTSDNWTVYTVKRW